MSDHRAIAQGTRRLTAVRRIVLALGAAATVALFAAVIVAPSPAVVVVLSACALVTGVLVRTASPPFWHCARTAHRRRPRGPITPSARRALAEFRRQLHSLPETAHPLGL
jgi:hypothetical protein